MAHDAGGDGPDLPFSKVGVLALQGSFREHVSALRKIGVEGVEVRRPEELAGLAGLIIPGGESTTMAKTADRTGLIPALKEFQASGKPVWGTCAGLIFLADRALGQKMGGQALLGGLDCTVHRNFFGSQINSFETRLPAAALVAAEGGEDTFRAVFIRAPAVVEVGAGVEVLAEYRLPPGSAPMDVGSVPAKDVETVAVAVRQGKLLATAFHPELTDDTRWHRLFRSMLDGSDGAAGTTIDTGNEASLDARQARLMSEPADLPVFKEEGHMSF